MLYYSISAIIRFGLNIAVTKPHYNKIVYSKKKFFVFWGNFGLSKDFLGSNLEFQLFLFPFSDSLSFVFF